MAPQDKLLQDIISRLDRLETTLSGGVAAKLPPNVDPSPDSGIFGPHLDPWQFWRFWPIPRFRSPIPIPEPGDPSPMDLTRLSRSQLEFARENIKAQRLRLEGLEQLINRHLEG